MTAPSSDAMETYLRTKIAALEVLTGERQQNLRRLEAQRNDLNSKGARRQRALRERDADARAAGVPSCWRALARPRARAWPVWWRCRRLRTHARARARARAVCWRARRASFGSRWFSIGARRATRRDTDGTAVVIVPRARARRRLLAGRAHAAAVAAAAGPRRAGVGRRAPHIDANRTAARSSPPSSSVRLLREEIALLQEPVRRGGRAATTAAGAVGADRGVRHRARTSARS